MASLDGELEEQLLQAGNKLVVPPSSVNELLSLLDRVENCLSKVEQSPTKSMQSALSPSLKELVADQLFRHSNVDVKVAVACCISEITRITAPDAPYDDDQMKEVFQLIVSSFKNLSDKSSRSYTKRTSILEIVANVRSCVVMLDLECDALILEMFQNFLKSIRDYNPKNVFSSMETIMNLVLEESEDISLELLTPILTNVKTDNEEVLPVARKLAERVLESSGTKLKPYLIQAVQTMGISFDDYSKAVASICQETSGDVEQNEDCGAGIDMADESKSVSASLDEAAQSGECKETQSEEHDLEYETADFGPTGEDIEMAGESPTVGVTAGESVTGVPSQGHDVSPTVHDVHHSKEPPEPRVESSGAASKGMSLEELLEKFAEDEENEKVETNFYPLSNDTVMFQRSEIPAEGQPLLAAIIRKHPHFMAGCKLGASLRKSGLQLLVAVLLDMQRTKLESSNLEKALEWKNALKDLLFMKFGVQFILDKIRAAAEACIARDDEFTVQIADLEREIVAKRAELSFLLSQRDALMQSSSAGGASSLAETFGDGLFD